MKFATTLILGALSASATYMVPQDDECILWQDGGYNSSFYKVKVDRSKCGNLSNYADPQNSKTGTMVNLSHVGWNDRMSSYACGKNVVYDFCKNNPGDDCWGQNGTHGGGPSRESSVGHNDSVTTWYGTCVNEDKQPAMIFRDSNCRSDAIRVDMLNEQRTYMNRADLEHAGMKNDSASSVMVPYGYTLYLYDNDGQQGQQEAVVGKPTDWDGMMVCQNLSMNDKTSSITYYKTDMGTYPVNGVWINEGTLLGGSQTFDFTTETTSTDSKTTTQEASNTISKEMTEGWEFESRTVTKSYTNSLTTATEQTLSQSQSQTQHVNCANSNFPDPYATSLYVWAAVSHDGEITTTTKLKMCRYNELASTKPLCPPSACVITAEHFQCEVCDPNWTNDYAALI